MNYVFDDFKVGMIMCAKVDDKTYGITKGEVYEILEIYEVANGDISIEFLNDINSKAHKSINSNVWPFDIYFEVVN